MFQNLVSKMRQFYNDVSAEDFTFIPVDLGTKTQYKHSHMPKKRKGGKPPADYEALETFIDFQLHLDRGEYDQAIPRYYRLKRMLNR